MRTHRIIGTVKLYIHFEVLASATKDIISRVAGILDLPLVFEKTDMSLRSLLPDCNESMQNIIICRIVKDFVYTSFECTIVDSICVKAAKGEGEGVKL